MGTLRLLQLDADNAAPIRDDVASTARVQAITESFELVFVEIYSAAADRTRLGCKYNSWRSVGEAPAAYARARPRRCVITSVVDVLAQKKNSPKGPGVLRATPLPPPEDPNACFRRGAKTW